MEIVMDEKLYVESKQLRELAERIIVKRRELHWLIECDLLPLIGYVQAFEDKKAIRGKTIFAECRKVSGAFKAFCPYEVLITFFPAADILTDNQRKIVMLHELKHIGDGKDGVTINPHTMEDFYSILAEFGIEYKNYGEDVPDILEEGEDSDKEKDELKEKRKQKRKAKG